MIVSGDEEQKNMFQITLQLNFTPLQFENKSFKQANKQTAIYFWMAQICKYLLTFSIFFSTQFLYCTLFVITNIFSFIVSSAKVLTRVMHGYSILSCQKKDIDEFTNSPLQNKSPNVWHHRWRASQITDESVNILVS